MSSAIKPPIISEDPLQSFRLLVVSKEPAVVRSLASLAENSRWQVEIASSGWDAMERLESDAAPELLLLDLPRGDGDSFHMLRWLRRLSPELPVAAICDAGDTLVRQEALRLGAERILSRPLDARQIQLLLRNYGDGGGDGGGDGADMESGEMVGDHVERVAADAFFVSASPAMQKLRAQAELLAQSNVPVFLLGEQGSGKAALARLIHKLSLRSGWRFRQINCAQLSGQRWEDGDGASGSERQTNFAGNFDLSEKGTIYFAEIAAMPAGLQARLLAALNHLESAKNTVPESTYSGHAEASAVRIVSATSDNLERALGERRLNPDLYRRLSAFTLQVPPLRQRREEIPILLEYAVRKLRTQYGLAAREFSPALLDACREYEWPGNLLELEEFVKRYLDGGPGGFPGVRRPAGEAVTPEQYGRSRNHSTETDSFGVAQTVVSGSETNLSPPPQSLAPQSLKSLIQDIKSEAERKAIGAALERTGWNRKAAARLLRVSYRTLLYKIEQYQLKAAPFFSADFSADPVVDAAGQNGGKRDGKAS
jgi:two-component system, NtrC family, response regulator AtoC